MNNNTGNNWSRNNRDRKGSNNSRQNNNPRSENRKHFQKFIDTKKSNQWQKNDYTNNTIKNSQTNSGIVPWIRLRPTNPLVIPKQHIHFEQQCENDHQGEVPSNHKEVKIQNEHDSVKHLLTSQGSEKEKNIAPTTEIFSRATETPVKTNFPVKIKQEKILNVKLKQERKSCSSSSSSESSSSEDELEPKTKTTDITDIKRPCSPLRIILKPKENIPSQTPTKTLQKLKPVSEPSPKSSSSSTSSDEDVEPPPPSKPATKINNKKKLQDKKSEKIQSTKSKNGSEDDVVFIGNLENKIILEDESDNEDEDVDAEHEEIAGNVCENLNKSPKKVVEKCMICDKKGHTSFQCQMICKNCSAPYHGYRTCPQPANLNTVLQLFIEFCMQQFQNFNTEKLLATNLYDSVPKPKVDSPHSTSANNKLNKFKRKHTKTNEANRKNKASKKRKISSAKKTKSKTDSDDSSGNDESNTDSETCSTYSEENTSDSSAATLVSSKKKRKMKNKSFSKTAPQLTNFTANPVSLPIVLNGFPGLTVPTQSVQNTNPSTNALNTLLLTQMFQNAIGSLKQ